MVTVMLWPNAPTLFFVALFAVATIHGVSVAIREDALHLERAAKRLTALFWVVVGAASQYFWHRMF